MYDWRRIKLCVKLRGQGSTPTNKQMSNQLVSFIVIYVITILAVAILAYNYGRKQLDVITNDELDIDLTDSIEPAEIAAIAQSGRYKVERKYKGETWYDYIGDDGESALKSFDECKHVKAKGLTHFIDNGAIREIYEVL